MDTGLLLTEARHTAGLRQEDLASLAGTSRSTLSAYEHGRKSPTLETTARLLSAAGFRLTIRPEIRFREHTTSRGRPVAVPNHLPSLPIKQALAMVNLPLHLNWSQRGRTFNLAERAERIEVYEIVITEGSPVDICTYIDGALLIDLWNELVLPREIHALWSAVIKHKLNEGA